VVVHRGDGEIGAGDGAGVHAQAVERLGARDLVHEVQVDEQQIRLAVPPADDVVFPDLLGERLGLRLRHWDPPPVLRMCRETPSISVQGVPYNGTASRYLGQGGYHPWQATAAWRAAAGPAGGSARRCARRARAAWRPRAVVAGPTAPGGAGGRPRAAAPPPPRAPPRPSLERLARS